MTFLMPLEINIDEQISLKLLDEEFAPSLFDIAQNNYDYFIKNITWISKIQSIGDELSFIQKSRSDYENGTAAHYAIFLIDHGPIGGISFNSIKRQEDQFNEASLGYWLCPEFQGKGFMHKSLSNLIASALEKTNIRSFIIKTNINNNNSIKLAQKNGFIFFKHNNENETHDDFIVMKRNF